MAGHPRGLRVEKRDHPPCYMHKHAVMWNSHNFINPPKYTHTHSKNPGNTKYVLDGHWFMEIDGN